MYYKTIYDSPLGELTLVSEETALVGAWLKNQRYFGNGLSGPMNKSKTEPLSAAKAWLDRYFAGEQPDISELTLHPIGSAFQKKVWDALKRIPYGTTITYGKLAKQMTEEEGRLISAQAVGGAVARNPLLIIVPCHRVVGHGGKLTGYAAGLDTKEKLLKHEGIDLSCFLLPDEISKEKQRTWTDGCCRCQWVNPKNERYVCYHDREWGVPSHDDQKLFQMLILELFQAGLSWECILSKEDAFQKAFSGFDLSTVCSYDKAKVDMLMQNAGIIRNRKKIEAAIINARIFREIQREYGSFARYLWQWTDGKVLYEKGRVRSELSDALSKDLKRRGMKFVGTTILYAYLQAVGVIYGHEEGCFLEHKE